MSDETPWMDVKQTAEYMRISERHLYRLKQDMPHSLIGKRHLFHRDAVDEYMRDRGKK